MKRLDASAFVKRHKATILTSSIGVALLLLLVLGVFYQRQKGRERQAASFVPGVYWVVGPFGPELHQPYEPELQPDPARTYKGANGTTLQWQELPVTPGVQCLDFVKLFRKENASGYALTYVISPEEQAGTLLMGSDDTIKVWVNGEMVHESNRPRGATPDEDRAAVRWKRGRNTLLVKVGNWVGDHQFFLKCVGAPGLAATTRPTE